MKRSVPLSQIRDTPVSVRLHGESLEPPPPLSPFRVPTQLDRERGHFRPTPRPVCVMQGCSKRVTDLPHLRLCSAHLVIIHAAVEADTRALGALIRRVDQFVPPIPIEPPRVVPPVVGIVYFLQVGGHIKIGWTSNLTKRMHAYPPNALLLATHPGFRKDELRLHKMFAAHRSHGREWYPLAPVILEHIKRVVAKYGKPVEVIFAAKPVEVPRPHSHQYVGGDGIGRGSTPRMVRG